jgi:hypothetical protein
MPLWGNTDFANNKPHFPQLREVTPVTSFITASAVASGNTIVVTAATNTNISLLSAGMYVYSADANNSIARLAKDLSIIDGNEASFWRSNNIITTIDAANATFRIQNNVMATLAAGSTVYVGQKINWRAGPSANAANDTILVTASRMANTQGTIYGYGSTVANTKLGNVNAGWTRITRKINNDGTIRFLKETLVALANPVAANTQSGNTSANAIFGGL